MKCRMFWLSIYWIAIECEFSTIRIFEKIFENYVQKFWFLIRQTLHFRLYKKIISKQNEQSKIQNRSFFLWMRQFINVEWFSDTILIVFFFKMIFEWSNCSNTKKRNNQEKFRSFCNRRSKRFNSILKQNLLDVELLWNRSSSLN